VRTNNAAGVAPGDTKPTSVFTIEKVEDRVRTIAHLSEPVEKQSLSDVALLESFIESELRLGLVLAEEGEILSGDGTGEHFTGILEVSGTQAQAWSTDFLTTTRKAVTKLEDVFLPVDAWVFNSADAERLELLTDDNNRFYGDPVNGAPINRNERRLWGIPYVVTPIMPAGQAILGAFAESCFIKDREQAVIDWSESVGDNFSKNLRTYRAEERLGFGVVPPDGFIIVDLTA
jgi:HK97 family phage major capsid protein